MFYAILFLAAVLALKGHLHRRRVNPGNLPLPPGPPRLPIVGALFGIKDLGAQWLTFAEWGKKYGTAPFRQSYPRMLSGVAR